jgi:histidinol-phosphatase (PHP family)
MDSHIGIESPRQMDYHLHTAVTIDGIMHELEACERALALGIQEIAFTNHVMLNQPKYIISPASFIRHWENIQECQKRYPQLKIRLGIEMDYYPNRESDINAKILFYEGLIGRPFDFILGSIHDIRGGFFSNQIAAVPFFKDREIVATYHEYFELAVCAVRSGLFNVIAHPDLIKKYTYQLTSLVSFEKYQDAVESFIDELVTCEVGIEVNTKGLRRPVQEPYPSNEFLELYISRSRALGKDPIITLGSDAHKVTDVGYGVLETIESLRKYQVNLASFERGNRSPFRI